MPELEHLEGEVIGFRQWRVGHDFSLFAGTQDFVWQPGVNTATCYDFEGSSEERHGAPGHDCECGLYALHEPGDLFYNDEFVTFIQGVVYGWGRMEVHPDGFRAEKMRIAALSSEGSAMAQLVVPAVAKLNDVPVMPKEELELMTQLGSTVPMEMRPSREEQIEWSRKRFQAAPQTGGFGGGFVVTSWTSSGTNIQSAPNAHIWQPLTNAGYHRSPVLWLGGGGHVYKPAPSYGSGAWAGTAPEKFPFESTLKQVIARYLARRRERKTKRARKRKR